MRLRKSLYGVALAVLWLLPAGLACEIIARGVTWWTVHHNPYISGVSTPDSNDWVPKSRILDGAIDPRREEIVPWNFAARNRRDTPREPVRGLRGGAEKLLGFDTFRPFSTLKSASGSTVHFSIWTIATVKCSLPCMMPRYWC